MGKKAESRAKKIKGMKKQKQKTKQKNRTNSIPTSSHSLLVNFLIINSRRALVVSETGEDTDKVPYILLLSRAIIA